jgi:glycosyltransferase involved in cell wall biosynthesis
MEMPFNYAKDVYGGTEYMARTWEKLVLPHMVNMDKYLCMIAPGVTPDAEGIIKDGRPVILWLHNTKSQFNPDYVARVLGHQSVIDRIAYIIVPSMWHKLWSAEEFNISLDRIKVIPNAIHPLTYNAEKFSNIKQVKIVHTSSAYRGLPILMNSLKHIDADFRLEVYNDYNPDLHYHDDQDTIDKRVRFYWKTPRRTVMEAVESAHILAYPSIYLETFCLSLAESQSAGNLAVYPELGALTEVGDMRGVVYEYDEDMAKHEAIFTGALILAINKVLAGEWNPEEQVESINSRYSWEKVTQDWIEFDKQLQGDK